MSRANTRAGITAYQRERLRQRLRLHADGVRRRAGLGPTEPRRGRQGAKGPFLLTLGQAREAAAAALERIPGAAQRCLEAADRTQNATAPEDAAGRRRMAEEVGTLTRAWLYTNEKEYLWRLTDRWRAAHRPGREAEGAAQAPTAEFRLAVWLSRLLEGEDAELAALFEADAGRLARTAYARGLTEPAGGVVERLSAWQALSLAGAALPVFEEADKWRATGRCMIRDALRDFLLEDGSLEGCCLSAHHRALSVLLEQYQLEEGAERETLREDVERIGDFLARLLQAGWPHPYLQGEAYATGLLTYEAGGLDLLAAAAVVLERCDWTVAAHQPSEAAFWLVGADAARRFDSLSGSPGAETPRVRRGHRQISGRHVSIHRAGGGCLLAGVESTEAPGALGFLWQRSAGDWVLEQGHELPGDTLFWSHGETLTILTGRNSRAERSILHFAAGRVMVLDRFRSAEVAPRQRWRVAGDLRRIGVQAGSIRVESAAEPTVVLLAASEAPWRSEVSETREAPAAPDGRVFAVDCRAEAAAERAMLLLPGEQARSPGRLERVSPQLAGGASVYVWRREASIEVFLFGDGSAWRALGWSGKARFVWWRADRKGEIEELVAAPGEELQAGKVRLEGAAGRIRWLRGDGVELPRLELAGETEPARRLDFWI